MSKPLPALAAIAAALSVSACVSAPPNYSVMAAGCPAMTRQVAITAERLVYVVATSLPDCRGPGPVLTIGRGTPMPFGSPMPYDGPVRYGVAGPPHTAAGKLPTFDLTGEPAWRQKLRADIATSKSKRVLLFVHGFNNAPAEVLSRADAIGVATGFDGPVIAFLWPSQRAVAKYTWDEENNRWTQPYLDQLLLALTSESEDVVLVAHSMGNRIAIDALRDLQRSHPGLSTHVRTIVLASPDVDREMFDRDLAAAIAGPERHITVYASRFDRALQTSWAVHGSPRAGDANCVYDLWRRDKTGSTRCYPKARPGELEVVDTSAVSSGLGHADFVETPEGAADLCHVVAGQPNPKGRAKGEGAFVLTPGVVDRDGCPEGPKRLALPAVQ
ncbi:alpha/beta hydrolase [Sphingomonas oligophenolica]|uniref:Alpha/beta fold hydrolase n=1 Tax=Sphingomonas oligophenolica TaxID=301154 RepID=A0ABU9XXT2_9SPHN